MSDSVENPTKPTKIDAKKVDSGEFLLSALIAPIRQTGEFFFDAGGAIVRAAVDTRPDGRLVGSFKAMSAEELLRHLLACGLIRIVRTTETGTLTLPLFKSGTYLKHLATALLNYGPFHSALPRLDGSYDLPGVIWAGEGAGARLIQPKAGLLGTIFYTGAPLLAPVDPALPHLHAWLSGVRFSMPGFRANLLGWICAAFARPACAEFPQLMIDARHRNIGKTRLAKAILRVLAGRAVSPTILSTDRRELDKVIAGYNDRPGPNFFFFDNVVAARGRETKVLSSTFLAAAATDAHVSLRANYGREARPIHFPIIVVTMNGVRVENDLADRVVYACLDGTPMLGYDPDPLTYAEAHGATIRAEILYLLTTMHIFPPNLSARWRGFEQIARSAASALGHAVDYSPGAYNIIDGLLREFILLAQECGAERAAITLEPMIRLFDAESTEGAFQEIRAFCREKDAIGFSSKVITMGKFIEKHADRPLTIDGRTLQFKVGKNDVNARTIQLTSESPHET